MPFFQRLLFLIVVLLMINSIRSSIIDIESTTQSIYEIAISKIRKTKEELEQEENQIEIDRKNLEEAKQISKQIENNDFFQLNVGGEIIGTTLETLTKIPKSILSLIFNGRWEHKLQRDKEGNIFFDFNPILFHHLLDQLQIMEKNDSIHFYPPSQPSLVEPFKKMIRKLGLDQFLSSEKKNVITFNVGGQILTNRRITFTQVSDSTFETIVSPLNNQSDVFLDYDPKLFQHLINQLREDSSRNIFHLKLSSDKEKISFGNMLIDMSIFVKTSTTTTSTTTTRTTPPTTAMLSFPQIPNNTKWKQNALTIAGGNGRGNQSNQLNCPHGIYVDDDNQSIYIADRDNHRIVQWKSNAKIDQVVAGGNGVGNRMNQLNKPTDVIVDRKTDSLIICDSGNSRIVRWPRQNGTNGEIIISDIGCYSLTIDKNGDLYVPDYVENEVRRWKIGEIEGTIVAGGNGEGNQLNQLNFPAYLFVDQDQSIYVSDLWNHRVMKWVKAAKEGIVVAGGQDQGNGLTQLDRPYGVVVDHFGDVYVADTSNHRIMRWSKESKEGQIIVGRNGWGSQPNQLSTPIDLSFDPQGNLHVADFGNDRVQKFEIDLN